MARPTAPRVLPLEFIEAADDCTIVEQGENWLLRERFTLAKCRYVIVLNFLPQQAVHYHTEANEQHAGGKVSMVIEEPQAGVMCVRFVYQTLPEQSPEEKHYASYVKKAYQQMDIESIRIIRELAEQGELNEPH